jgi:hypothetical protein
MLFIQAKLVAVSKNKTLDNTLFERGMKIIFRQTNNPFDKRDLGRMRQVNRFLRKEISDFFTHIEAVISYLVSIPGSAVEKREALDLVVSNANKISPLKLVLIRSHCSDGGVADMLITRGFGSKTDEEKIKVARAIHFLGTTNAKGRPFFETRECAQMWIQMGCTAQNDETKKEIVGLIFGDQMFCEEIRHRLSEATDEEKIALLKFLSIAAFNNNPLNMILSADISELLNMASKASTEKDRIAWAEVFYSMRFNYPLNLPPVLDQPPILGRLVEWGETATTEEFYIVIAKVIHLYASRSAQAREFFSTQECAAMFFAMGKTVKTDGGRLELLGAVSAICMDNKLGKVVFATPAWVNILEDIRKISPGEKMLIGLAETLGHLINEYVGSTHPVSVSSYLMELLITMGLTVTTDEGQIAVENAVVRVIKDNPLSRERLCSTDCVKMCTAHGAWASTEEARQSLIELTQCLIKEPSGPIQHAFSTSQFADVLIKMGMETRMSKIKDDILILISMLTFNNPKGKKAFNKEAYPAMCMRFTGFPLEDLLNEDYMKHCLSSRHTIWFRDEMAERAEKILTAIFNSIEGNPEGKKAFSKPEWSNFLVIVGVYLGRNFGELVLKTLLSLVTDSPDYTVFQTRSIKKMLEIVKSETRGDRNRKQIKDLLKAVKTILFPPVPFFSWKEKWPFADQ